MELHTLVLTFPDVQTLCIEEFAPMQHNFIFPLTANSIIGITLVDPTPLACPLFRDPTNAKFYRVFHFTIKIVLINQ